MIENFNYYLEIAAVRRKIPNISLAKSLLDKAGRRLALISAYPLSSSGAAILLEDAYEAMRESAQSLMEIKGFKPYSHEALIAFLSENKFLGSKELAELDRYRIIRNRSVYEAKEISLETGKDALEFAKELIPKIKAIFLKESSETKS